MEEVSIFRLKFNYYDLQSLALIFLELNILSPFIFIAALFSLKHLIFWIISMINRNKYWKYLYIPFNELFRKRYWGLIIDEKDFKPVSFAKVKLIKFEKKKDNIVKKIIATTISDYYGRYYFNYKEDYTNLFIEVHCIGYKKYYKEIDTLSHIHDNTEMVYDVYLSPRTSSYKPELIIYTINTISNVMIFVAAVIGLLLSIYNQLTSGQFSSFIMCAIYIFIIYLSLSALLRKFTLKKLEVLESLLMQKIPGAVVRLYDKKHQLHIAVTNKKGYVLLDWMPGVHQILVTKKGYELIDDNTGTKNKKMYLTNNKYVKLKKKAVHAQSLVTTTKDIKIRTSLQNPFSKPIN